MILPIIKSCICCSIQFCGSSSGFNREEEEEEEEEEKEKELFDNINGFFAHIHLIYNSTFSLHFYIYSLLFVYL
jgi:hypothetical protein